MGFMDNVKGFAAKVGSAVENGAKSVSDNSKKIAEKSKVKREISQLETELNNAYLTIGKKYFELHSASPEADYAESVDNIVKNNERIEKFRLLLASMEDKQQCSGCGAEVTRGQKFCDKCGTKVEFAEAPIIEGFNDQTAAIVDVPADVVEEAAESSPAFCSGCGAALDAGVKFCDKCGTKVE